MMKTNARMERDSLGEWPVPADRFWGIHTERARTNFPLGGPRVPAALVHALAVVKQACCRANAELGYLEAETAEAIARACDAVARGEYDGEFPLPALQGGAGTSTNMNVNEVVANLALEALGLPRGAYDRIHPLAHVNRHQSTNDVYPTALRIALIRGVRTLSEALAGLQGAFQEREQAFASVVKVGRTELVDAVPMTLGTEFSAFAEAVARDRWRTFKCEERLRVVNLGGTAVGTGLGAPRDYIFLVIEKLRELTGLGLARGENLAGETAHADTYVEVSGILAACACTLIKIAQDLRLLQLTGQLVLPAAQVGSSIMPGKVNPVILESVIQVGLAVRANDGIVGDCASRGSLQINEFLPLLGGALLESVARLTEAAGMLARHVPGIAAAAAPCRDALRRSPAAVTALVPFIGYDACVRLLEHFAAREPRLEWAAFLESELGADVVARALSPQNLTALGHRNDANNP